MEAQKANAYEELYTAITLLRGTDEIQMFLHDLLSEKELHHASKRWCVTRQLLDQVIQSEARATCGCSKNMVTRTKRVIIDEGTGICSTIHQRMKAMPA